MSLKPLPHSSQHSYLCPCPLHSTVPALKAGHYPPGLASSTICPGTGWPLCTFLLGFCRQTRLAVSIGKTSLLSII